MKLPKSDADIEAWAREYPDVAKIVETIAMKKAKEQSAELESRIQKIDEMSAEATKDKAEAALMQIHPDFDEIRDSDEFHDWAEEQPKWVQDALYENDNDARSAARAIDLYKSDKGIGKDQLQQRVIRVLLLKLVRKIHVLRLMLQNQVKRYVSLLYKRCRLNSMKNKLTQ
jgi:hypothetical protein